MAGVTGYRSLVDGLFNLYMGMERQMLADTQEAALEAAIAGEDAVRKTIDTTESDLSPGKPNRNWTFHMRESVDSRVRRDGNTIHIRVGWLDTKEGYFLIQEDGGTVHGTTVTPMNALFAGQAAVIDTLKGWGLKTT